MYVQLYVYIIIYFNSLRFIEELSVFNKLVFLFNTDEIAREFVMWIYFIYYT